MEQNQAGSPSRQMIIPTMIGGLDPDDPTIDDICDDGDLEKLSPRLLVDPEAIIKEEEQLLQFKKAQKEAEVLEKKDDGNNEDVEESSLIEAMGTQSLKLEKIMSKTVVNMSRTLSLNKQLIKDNESDNHFICTICFKILYEPMECSKCQTAFCEDCVEGWKKNSTDCPIKCKSPNYHAMHRFVKKILYEHRFFCPMANCEYHKVQQMTRVRESQDKVNFLTLGLEYKDALEHQKTCQYRMRHCPNKCGRKLFGKDECDKPNLEMHQFFYRCSEWSTCNCNYDLCRHCALIKCDPPVLSEKQKFKFHDCEVERHPRVFEGWCCSASNAEKFPASKGVCESGMTTTRHSTHIQGYQCRPCNFDVCLLCALKYKEQK